MNFIPILILFAGGIVLTMGDLIFKTWIERGATYSALYVVGVLLYLVGSMFLVESYKHDINIVAAGIIQVLFNTIILTAFTYFYFNEPLTIPQVFGIALGIASIYLLK